MYRKQNTAVLIALILLFTLFGCKKLENNQSSEQQTDSPTSESLLTNAPVEESSLPEEFSVTIIAAIPAVVYPSNEDREWQSGAVSLVPDPEAEDGGEAPEYLCGPESFCFDEEGNICILDTYANRVLVVSAEGNEIKNTIELPGAAHATDIAAGGGAIYVLDESQSEVIAVRGDAVERFKLSASSRFLGISFIEGELKVMLDNNKAVALTEDGGYKKSDPPFSVATAGGLFIAQSGENKWSIPLNGMGITLLGSDSAGRLLVVCEGEFADAEGNIGGDTALRIYDRESRLVSEELISTGESRLSPPIHGYKLDNENRFCGMFVTESGLEIRRIIPAAAAR